MHTELCALLGVRHPIIAGAMMGLATPEFAAAVSNAGAMGSIAAGNYLRFPQLLRDAIRRARALTDKPFLVNVSLFPDLIPEERAGAFFRVIAEEGVGVVETSGRSPRAFLPMLKEAGVKVIHKVPAVRYGEKMASIGVDAVTLVGMECAGRPGADEVSTLALIPVAAERLGIPVIAGGGIASGRAMAAALALGASGVVMGTRMLATAELALPQIYKNRVVQARETDTILLRSTMGAPMRLHTSEELCRLREMERIGTPDWVGGPEHIGGRRPMDAPGGEAALPLGQGVGQVHSVKPVRAVIQDIMDEAERVIRALAQTVSQP
ncbi:MAG: nitronate monooxygenase [Oscillospiraceae bacterium]|nr:nitronate monooxygenase [Oscillospiraceae bacterium]